MADLQIGIKLVTVDQDAVQCRYLQFRYSPFSLYQKAGDTTYKKSCLRFAIRDSRSLHYRKEKGAIGTT
jgi:hypothetical protein